MPYGEDDNTDLSEFLRQIGMQPISGSPSRVEPRRASTAASDPRAAIDRAADKWGVDRAVAHGLAYQESRYNPNAEGPMTRYGWTAKGLTQISPDVARQYGVKNIYDPDENANAGMAYLRSMIDKYGPDMGIAAYNMGPGNADKVLNKQMVMPKQTQDYLPAVKGYANQYRQGKPLGPQKNPVVKPADPEVQSELQVPNIDLGGPEKPPPGQSFDEIWRETQNIRPRHAMPPPTPEEQERFRGNRPWTPPPEPAPSPTPGAVAPGQAPAPGQPPAPGQAPTVPTPAQRTPEQAQAQLQQMAQRRQQLRDSVPWYKRVWMAQTGDAAAAESLLPESVAANRNYQSLVGEMQQGAGRMYQSLADLPANVLGSMSETLAKPFRAVSQYGKGLEQAGVQTTPTPENFFQRQVTPVAGGAVEIAPALVAQAFGVPLPAVTAYQGASRGSNQGFGAAVAGGVVGGVEGAVLGRMGKYIGENTAPLLQSAQTAARVTGTTGVGAGLNVARAAVVNQLKTRLIAGGIAGGVAAAGNLAEQFVGGDGQIDRQKIYETFKDWGVVAALLPGTRQPTPTDPYGPQQPMGPRQPYGPQQPPATGPQQSPQPYGPIQPYGPREPYGPFQPGQAPPTSPPTGGGGGGGGITPPKGGGGGGGGVTPEVELEIWYDTAGNIHFRPKTRTMPTTGEGGTPPVTGTTPTPTPPTPDVGLSDDLGKIIRQTGRKQARGEPPVDTGGVFGTTPTTPTRPRPGGGLQGGGIPITDIFPDFKLPPKGEGTTPPTPPAPTGPTPPAPTGPTPPTPIVTPPRPRRPKPTPPAPTQPEAPEQPEGPTPPTPTGPTPPAPPAPKTDEDEEDIKNYFDDIYGTGEAPTPPAPEPPTPPTPSRPRGPRTPLVPPRVMEPSDEEEEKKEIGTTPTPTPPAPTPPAPGGGGGIDQLSPDDKAALDRLRQIAADKAKKAREGGGEPGPLASLKAPLPSREESEAMGKVLLGLVKNGHTDFNSAAKQVGDALGEEAAPHMAPVFEAVWDRLRQRRPEMSPTGSFLAAQTAAPVESEAERQFRNRPITEEDIGRPPIQYKEPAFEAELEGETSPERFNDREVTALLDHMEGGGSFSRPRDLRRFAYEKLGKDIKPGTIEDKHLDEGVERAAVAMAQSIAQDTNTSPEEKFDALRDVESRMPVLDARTSTSTIQQAYSTPLPLAYVASELAHVNRNKTVYEPTIGHGALVMAADPAKVTGNEINADRHASARELMPGAAIRHKDALDQPTEPRNLTEHDVVLANPPFGIPMGSAGYTVPTPKDKNLEPAANGQFKTNHIDHAIAISALQRMKDDGRAVLIVGGVTPGYSAGLEADRAKFYRSQPSRNFYGHLYNNYNVVDHFTAAGNIYAKQGTKFPVDVIVINGRGKSALDVPGVKPPRVITTPDELKEVLRANDEGRPTRPAESGLQPGREGARGQGVQLPGGEAGQRVVPGAPRAARGEDAGKGARPEGELEPTTDITGQPLASRQLRAVHPEERQGSVQEQPPVSRLARLPLNVPGVRQAGQAGEPRGGGAAEPGRQPLGVGGRPAKGEPRAVGTLSPEDQASFNKLRQTAADRRARLESEHGVEGPLRAGPAELPSREESELMAKVLLGLVKQGLTDFNEVAGSIIQAFGDDAPVMATVFEGVWKVLSRRRPEMSPAGNYMDVYKNLKDAQAPMPPPPVKKKPYEDVAENEPTQIEYESRSKTKNIGTVTPTNLATAAQAALKDLEDLTGGDVDQYVQDAMGFKSRQQLAKAFSGEQVDAIAASFYQMDRGSAFILGDSTGVGKGRVAAAVIDRARKQGKKVIFLTETPDLFSDMYRDLKNIGAGDIKPFITNADEKIALNQAALDFLSLQQQMRQQKQPVPQKAPPEAIFLRTPQGKDQTSLMEQMLESGQLKGKLPGKKGKPEEQHNFDVIFTTYDQLNTAGARRNFIANMSQGAVLVLDESHNAGGGDDQQRRKASQAVNTAQFVRKMTQVGSFVHYSSATYAKRPSVMDLYGRTDMSLAVKDLKELGQIMIRGGVPMQQVMAAMLTRGIQYMRREHSFKGINYDQTVVEVNKKAVDEAARMMRAIYDFDKYKERRKDVALNNLIREGKVVYDRGDTTTSMNFTSTMWNLNSQFLLAMKADKTAELAVEASKAGKKPLIMVASTMGSFIKEFVEDNRLKPGMTIPLDFRGMFERYLRKSRTITIKDRLGDKTYHYMTDDEIGPRGLKMFNDTLDMINKADIADLPISPIDWIHYRFKQAGLKLAEITGREHTVEYSDTQQPTFRKRKSGTAVKQAAAGDFNKGTADGLIYNQSGSTGISLHASETVEDQRQRETLIAQAESNVDTHMQGIGRSNRTGQVEEPNATHNPKLQGVFGKPQYKQLAADVPAELRPSAILMKKMAGLNANTTGARSTAVTADVVDFVNEYGDTCAVQMIDEYPDLNEKLGSPIKWNDSDSKWTEKNAAARLTGRLGMLPHLEQEEFYKVYIQKYLDYVQSQERMGSNILEAKLLDLQAVPKAIAEIIPGREGMTSPFAGATYMTRVRSKKLGKPPTSAQAFQKIKDISDEDARNIEQWQSKMRARSAEVRASIAAKRDAYLETISEEANKKKDELDEIARQAKIKDDADPLIEDKEAADRRRESRLNEAKGAVDAKDAADQDRARKHANHLLTILQNTPLGDSVQIVTPDGILYGYLANVKPPAKSKNPVVMSGWKFDFVIADADPHLVLPGSQINTPQGMGMAHTERYAVFEEGQPTTYIPIIDAFDKVQTETHETRYIMTGNLPAGFAALNYKGSIINYTDNKGDIHQGIRMPRGYATRELEGLAVPFLSADQAKAFTTTASGRNLLVETQDGILSIERKDGTAVPEYNLLVERKGGQIYYQNSRLMQMVSGGEFVKSGKNFMRATLRGNEKLNDLIDALYQGVVDDRPKYLESSRTSQRAQAREHAGMPSELFSDVEMQEIPEPLASRPTDRVIELEREPTKTQSTTQAKGRELTDEELDALLDAEDAAQPPPVLVEAHPPLSDADIDAALDAEDAAEEAKRVCIVCPVCHDPRCSWSRWVTSGSPFAARHPSRVQENPSIVKRFNTPPVKEPSQFPDETAWVADTIENSRMVLVPGQVSKANAPFIMGNRHASIMLFTWLQAVGQDPGQFNGLTMTRKNVADMISYAYGLAGNLQPQYKRRIDDMVSALRQLLAEDPSPRLVYVDGDDEFSDEELESVLQHELGVHHWQFQIAPMGPVPMNWFAAQPEFKQWSSHLLSRGYKLAHLPLEVPAHVLSGAWASVGYTGPEGRHKAIDFAARYLHEVARRHGAFNLDKFVLYHSEFHSVAEAAKNAARANSQTTTPSSGTGGAGQGGQTLSHRKQSNQRLPERNGAESPENQRVGQANAKPAVRAKPVVLGRPGERIQDQGRTKSGEGGLSKGRTAGSLSSPLGALSDAGRREERPVEAGQRGIDDLFDSVKKDLTAPSSPLKADPRFEEPLTWASRTKEGALALDQILDEMKRTQANYGPAPKEFLKQIALQKLADAQAETLGPVAMRAGKREVVEHLANIQKAAGVQFNQVLSVTAPAKTGYEGVQGAQIVRHREAQAQRQSDMAAYELGVEGVSTWFGLARKYGMETSAGVKAAAAKLDTIDQLEAKVYETFQKLPKTAGWDFVDAIEAGDTSKLPRDQQKFAAIIRQMLDERRRQIQALGLGKLDDYYENYYPRILKMPGKNQPQGGAGPGRTPFETWKSFLKYRKYPTFKEARDAQFEAISDNPIDMLMSKIGEMDKYIFAQYAKQDMKDEGLLKAHPALKELPQGWARINDPMGRITQIGPGGSVINWGYWIAPKPLANLLNNHLSPGMEKVPAYRAARSLNNHLTAFRLGLSAFHAGMTGFNAAISQGSLGLQRIFYGALTDKDWKEASAGMKDVLQGLAVFPSVVRTYSRGRHLSKAWHDDTYGSPEIQAMISNILKGGGRGHQAREYALQATKGLKNAMQDYKKDPSAFKGAEILVRSVATGVEQFSRPIMELMVPYMKLGATAALAEIEMNRLGPTATLDEQRAVMGKIVDSIDNRFGQVFYDNIFWHKIIKDSLMLALQAVGWTLGSMREIGGGVLDSTKLLTNLLAHYGFGRGAGLMHPAAGGPPRGGGRGGRGGRGGGGGGGGGGLRPGEDPGFFSGNAEFTYRASYVVMLMFMNAVWSGLWTYLLTGEKPHGYDYLAARDGTLDEYQRPNRLTFPTYVRDMLRFGGGMRRWVVSKMSPLFSMTGELIANEDYYHRQIYSTRDKKAMVKDIAQYVAEGPVPYSWRNRQQLKERGVTGIKQYLPFIGITPATSREVQSKAENILTGYLSERSRDVRPKESEAKDKMKAQIIRDLRLGHDIGPALKEAADSGKFSRRQLQQILGSGQGPAIVAKFKAVLQTDIPGALEAWDAATNEERSALYPELVKKLRNMRNASPEDQERYIPMLTRAIQRMPLPAQSQPLPAPAP